LALIGAAVASTFSTGALSQPAATSSDAAYSDGVDPMQATPTQREQAQTRFVRGKELFDQGNFEAALVEFDASRAIVASPNTRLYRARCLRQRGQLVLAYTELGRTMVEALELVKLEARYARTVEAATDERKSLEAELGFVNVTVHHPRAETRLFVNGEEVRRSAWSEPLPSAPGAVQVKVSTPGLADTVKDAEVTAGASVDVAVDLGATPASAPAGSAPPPKALDVGASISSGERPASLRPYAFIAGGVGVLGLGAFGVFGAMSRRDYQELEDACSDDRCPASSQDTIDRGRSHQRLANIGLAVGAVGVGAAVTLWLLEPRAESAGNVALEASWSSVRVRGSW
jgi:hypothetical protein